MFHNSDRITDFRRLGTGHKKRKFVAIFYLTVSSGIDIIRVLHGARDIATIFAADEA